MLVLATESSEGTQSARRMPIFQRYTADNDASRCKPELSAALTTARRDWGPFDFRCENGILTEVFASTASRLAGDFEGFVKANSALYGAGAGTRLFPTRTPADCRQPSLPSIYGRRSVIDGPPDRNFYAEARGVDYTLLSEDLFRFLDVPLDISAEEIRRRFPEIRLSTPTPFPGSSTRILFREGTAPLFRNQSFIVENDRLKSYAVHEGLVPTGEWSAEDEIVNWGPAFVHLLNQRFGKPARSAIHEDRDSGLAASLALEWRSSADRYVRLLMSSPRELSGASSDINPVAFFVLTVSSGPAASRAKTMNARTTPWDDRRLCANPWALERLADVRLATASARFFPPPLDWLRIGMSTAGFGDRAVEEDFMPGSIYYVEDSSYPSTLHARRGVLTSATFAPKDDDTRKRFLNWVDENWGNPGALYSVWKDDRYHGLLFDWPEKEAAASLLVRADGGPLSAQVRHALWEPTIHLPRSGMRYTADSEHTDAAWDHVLQTRGLGLGWASVELFEDALGKKGVQWNETLLRGDGATPLFPHVRVPPTMAPRVVLAWSRDGRVIRRDRISLSPSGFGVGAPFLPREPGRWSLAVIGPGRRILVEKRITVPQRIEYGSFILELKSPYKFGHGYSADGYLSLPEGWVLRSPLWSLMSSTTSLVPRQSMSTASRTEISLINIPPEAVVGGATVSAKGVAAYRSKSFELEPVVGNGLKIDSDIEVTITSVSPVGEEIELIMRVEYTPNLWRLPAKPLEVYASKSGRPPSRLDFILDRRFIELIITGHVPERVGGNLTVVFPIEVAKERLRVDLMERADVAIPVRFRPKVRQEHSK